MRVLFLALSIVLAASSVVASTASGSLAGPRDTAAAAGAGAEASASAGALTVPERFEFLLPLGPRCLTGAFPITIGAATGTLTLEIGVLGEAAGDLALDGSPSLDVTGKHKTASGASTLKLTAVGTSGSLKLSGSVQGTDLAGTAKGLQGLAGLTGPITADLSNALPATADVTLDLLTDDQGRLSGTGTAALCGIDLPFTAKGKSKNGKATLSLKGTGFSFSGKGTAAPEGFIVDWSGKSSGEAATGRLLLIARGDPPVAKDPTVDPLSAFRVDPPSPAGGTNAVATFDLPGATLITLSAFGAGCGAFGSAQQAGSHLEVSRAVGAFGACSLSADAATPQGPRHFETTFVVEPTDVLLPALEVLDGVFRPGVPPPASGVLDDPNVASLEAPGTLINGGTARLRIHLVDPSQAVNVTTVFVSVQGAQGFSGYYEVPPILDGEALAVDLRLAEESTAPASDYARTRFATQFATQQEIGVKLRNRFGAIGTSVPKTFPTRDVGSGELKVSVSWNTPTDVDLHVVEPSGFEIYYGATQSPSGGQLDLDSNPGCGIDGVNNENIVWGSDAPAGEYIVRVDFYSDCDPPPRGAAYTVTVNACGDVKTYSGSFAAGSDDAGGRGSGAEVTRFTIGCGKKRVRGTATYEDFAQTDSGLAASSNFLPIRFAKVEARRASDDFVLARGETKQDGSFDLTFENTGTPGYYVEVRADQKNGIIDQYVVNKNEKVYTARSLGTIDETQTPDRQFVEINAYADGSGPAFNIFDIGVEAAATMRLITGSTPPRLKWLWTKGNAGLCDGNVSCFSKAKKRISVLSIAADPDEYDDLVLLHEYGHFFQSEFADSNSPGGDHSSRQRSVPTLAWGEGSATFFGNYVRKVSVYLDTNATGLERRTDIEDLDPAIPTGTDTGDMDGKLSEAIVAAIMWDIADATTVPSDKGKDALTDPNGLFGALSYMRSSFFSDRGFAGADLADLLDGWFCVGNGKQPELEDIVFEIHFFDYDFLGPAGTCRGTAAGRDR